MKVCIFVPFDSPFEVVRFESATWNILVPIVLVDPLAAAAAVVQYFVLLGAVVVVVVVVDDAVVCFVRVSAIDSSENYFVVVAVAVAVVEVVVVASARVGTWVIA